MARPLHLGEVKDSTKSFLARMLRLIIYAFIILLLIVIIKGILKKDELVLQPIHSPKHFNESGFDGPFIAKKLHQEIIKIYTRARTVREDETEFNVDQSKDINMNVMGLGVSASNIIYHLRDLMGVQTNYVSGNITDMENILSLSIHISDPSNSKTIHLNYADGDKRKMFDSLIYEGAKFITEIQNPYRLAIYHNRNQNTSEALRIVRKLAQNKEDKKWAYNLWGNIIKDEKGLEKSIEYYKVALEDDPSFELAHRNLGWTYFTLEKYEEAIPHFNKALEENSSNPLGNINGLSLAYERLGEVEKARKYFKENIKLFPDNIGTYRNYTQFLRRQEDTLELASVFDEARAKSFEGPMYYMMMGGYYFYQNKLDSSYLFFDKAVDLQPNSVDALLAMVEIADVRASSEKEDSAKHIKTLEALDITRRLYPLVKDNENYDAGMSLRVLNKMAIFEYLTDQIDSSLAHINIAIKEAPNFGLFYSTKAEAYAMRGDNEAFFRILETAFLNGFEFDEIWIKDEPYSFFKDSARFHALIKKYAKKKEDLKN